jgi:hypothetical protein
MASVKPSQMVRSSGQPATTASTTSMGARNSTAARRRWAITGERTGVMAPAAVGR